jgi:plasmid stabilization system protein ParE
MTAERGFKLHPGAASDVTSIWEFIAKDNPLAAKRVREDILDAIRRPQRAWLRLRILF